MRAALRYLRLKSSKPIPKKGSLEYLELQKRLIERKTKVIEEIKEQTPEKVPKFFKYSISASAFPSTLGLLTMMFSEPTSSLFANTLNLTGCWIGISTAFFSAYNVGLEAYLYQSNFYHDPRNFFFTGGRRIWTSFLGIPMGLVCIYSTVNSDWIGLCFYFLYLLTNTLIVIRGNDKFLTPAWLGGSHWPWLVQTQLIVVFMIYSLLSSKT